MKRILIGLTALLVLASCSNNDNQSDAFGNFEATEIIVSAESNGKIYDVFVDEGDKVTQNQTLGIIDTVQLKLKSQQLSASISALNSKTRDIETQIDVLIVQKSNVQREYDRAKRLYKDSAITLRQLEELEGQVKLIDKNIIATKRSLSDANRGMLSEQKPLELQIDQIADNLAKSYISSPIEGVVLKKYIEAGEIVNFGKPLLKLANVDDMTLRVYVSGAMLSRLSLGQKVKVKIDKGEDDFYEYDGNVKWISDKAEFTPKIVQTKEERVNLVYAVKISVANDGKIKIGMPGEVEIMDKQK